jgi:hypothetical protein
MENTTGKQWTDNKVYFRKLQAETLYAALEEAFPYLDPDKEDAVIEVLEGEEPWQLDEDQEEECNAGGRFLPEGFDEYECENIYYLEETEDESGRRIPYCYQWLDGNGDGNIRDEVWDINGKLFDNAVDCYGYHEAIRFIDEVIPKMKERVGEILSFEEWDEITNKIANMKFPECNDFEQKGRSICSFGAYCGRLENFPTLFGTEFEYRIVDDEDGNRAVELIDFRMIDSDRESFELQREEYEGWEDEEAEDEE